MTAPFVLLTDFGSDDPYAGQMRAALHALAPHRPLLDLSHGVPPHAISSGALFLTASLPYFPRGSLFLCVVDPGVGSARPIHCVVQQGGRGQILLGPGNGVLSLAARRMEREGGAQWFSLEPPPPDPAARPSGSTFHGRDVFPRLALSIAAGVPLTALGSPLLRAPRLPDWADPVSAPEGLECAVLHVDRFGNCILNLDLTHELPDSGCALLRPAAPPVPLCAASHYAELPPGAFGLLRGSQGYWELACREQSAALGLGLAAGQRCLLSLLPEHGNDTL